jgi:hypothetical protein
VLLDLGDEIFQLFGDSISLLFDLADVSFGLAEFAFEEL